jgi:hypothetical protein
MRKILRKALEPIGVWYVLRKIKNLIKKFKLKKFTDLQDGLIVESYYQSKGSYKELSKSQHGQELFIYEEVFKNKENGTFVEVGGNHPVIINNTYFLEKIGWKGISV